MHNLMIQNGEASMFYIGQIPWHGLGTRLDKPATAREAITAARLDWEVEKRPLQTTDGIPVPDRFAVMRKDGNKAVLGIAGDGYTPLQNHEAFAFFDPVVGKDAAIYHTAGALGQGERIWLLAKLPGHLRVVGDDVSEKYLLLANGHDGTLSLQVKFTPVRVVCQNTLAIALNGGESVRILHTRDIHHRMKDAERMLGIVTRGFGQMEESFQAMAKVPMDRKRLAEYLAEVYPAPSSPEDLNTQLRAQRDRSWSEYFFDQGQGNRLPGVEGTLWAAFNGVTEWLDHRQTRRGDDQRLNSTWFGASYRTKARALSVAGEKLAIWSN